MKNLYKKYPWFNIVPLGVLLKHNSSIKIEKYLEKIFYTYDQFPPSSLYPNEGFCSDCFVLYIPNGKAQGIRGDIFVKNNYIKDMAYMGFWQLVCRLPKVSEEKIQKVSGKVAVISQDLTGYYFHWLQDVLGRLALLEMHGIEYDYLYVPCNKKFMKESLELWGIETHKIISPSNYRFCIQANELIVPSFVVNKNQGSVRYTGFHNNPVTMEYVAQKLVQAAKLKNIDTQNFSKRVFVSRKDAKDKRRILNEDEIFSLLESKGFVRYELSAMSVAEQIMLFNGAEIIVGEHGAGLTNCLFCKPGTRVIEIFQNLIDSGPWWITQVMNLDYSCVQTLDVDINRFALDGMWSKQYKEAWKKQITVPLKKIKKIIKKIKA